jgi:hypothetical protein
MYRPYLGPGDNFFEKSDSAVTDCCIPSHIHGPGNQLVAVYLDYF